MPAVTIRTSLKDVQDSNSFLLAVSKSISELTGKPETYVMTLLHTGMQMSFAGSLEPCCFVEVDSIGSLSPKSMSKTICELIESHLGIESNRTYIKFFDVEASKWGFDKTTFG